MLVVAAGAQVCSGPCALPHHYDCSGMDGFPDQHAACMSRNLREKARFNECVKKRLDCERQKKEAERRLSQWGKRPFAEPTPKPGSKISLCKCRDPRYEECNSKAADYQDCIAWNRSERARFTQCMDQRAQRCKEELQAK